MLLLLCWYKDPLQEHIDRSLEQENPVSYITLELYTAVADDKKLLSVLNEYLLDVSDSPIDYNAVFDSVMGFLQQKYKSMPMKEITTLMYELALHSGRYLDDPWYTIYLIDDFFDEAKGGGNKSMESFCRRFEALINNRVPF